MSTDLTPEEYYNPKFIKEKLIKSTTKIHKMHLQKFLFNIYKENSKKYVCKKEYARKRYFDYPSMLQEVGELLIELNPWGQDIVEVPIDWKERVEIHFSIKKIKSKVNSLNEKKRIKGIDV